MSTLSLEPRKFGRLALGTPAAGRQAVTIRTKSIEVAQDTRFGVAARQSFIFNDLYALAQEQ